MTKLALNKIPTFVYIDASNIRNALRHNSLMIDFPMLFAYLQKKYKKIRKIKYFEGLHQKDTIKQEELAEYESDVVEIKTLSRKSYTNRAKYKNFRCNNCQTNNKVQVLKPNKKFKSNIDVYLCSELMSDVINRKRKTHIVLYTCDGDFAEMIKKLMEINSLLYFTVVAPPYSSTNNYLSSRFKELGVFERYFLVDIFSIKDKITIKK
ncbi:NYN domain-containing protein [Patescibacteria group bacterium]|nr:NYN domain-containing protein [Patescibacteria group bacterium]